MRSTSDTDEKQNWGTTMRRQQEQPPFLSEWGRRGSACTATPLGSSTVQPCILMVSSTLPDQANLCAQMVVDRRERGLVVQRIEKENQQASTTDDVIDDRCRCPSPTCATGEAAVVDRHETHCPQYAQRQIATPPPPGVISPPHQQEMIINVKRKNQ